MKKEAKLSLCFICRNRDEDELTTIPKMLDSIKDYVDEICVTVTSKEARPEIEGRLQKILDSYGCKISVFKSKGIVLKGNWFISNFAEARNFNFSQASNELVMWVDADDIVVNVSKIPEMIKLFNTSPITSIFFPYEYSFDEDGNCNSIFPRERIVRKSLYTWKAKLHENLICHYQPTNLIREDIIIRHNCKVEVSAMKALRNFEIIQAAYKEEVANKNVDPRTVYDYARSAAALGANDEAIKLFLNFLNLSESDTDKYDALCRMSDINLLRNKLEASKTNLYSALNLNSDLPDAYFRMAKLFFMQKKYEHCLEWLSFGFFDRDKKKRKTSKTLPVDPLEYDFKPLKMMASCLLFGEKEQPKEALSIVRKCLKICPSDQELVALEKSIVNILNFMRATEGALVTLDVLKDEGSEGKIKGFIEHLPNMVKQHPDLVKLRHKYFPVNADNKLIIYCDRAFEDWGPESIKTGIGGSEEAVINIARQLDKLGWNVEVYNQRQDVVKDGSVTYYPWDQYDSSNPCEVFIAWRMVEYIPLAPEGSVKILWCHDIQSIEHYNKDVIDMIDKIFVLSKYHRENLPEIPDEKFFITRNGIDSEQFHGDLSEPLFDSRTIEKYKNNYIYPSSPDRGLIHILRNWDKVLEVNPEAKLHIFYGFTKTFDANAERYPEMWDLKDEILKIVDKYDSIIWHGRVGHKELAEWFMKCRFWLYPADFAEISCISAMKAQAAGCWPVCNDFAALKETVCFGGTVTKCDQKDPIKSLDRWVASLKSASCEATPQARSSMRRSALNFFSWKTLAGEWTKLFKSLKEFKSNEIGGNIDVTI